MTDFKRIAVIGAGTMGSGIAAQVANAGHKVLLMDLPRDDDPLGVVNAAKDRLLKSDPPALVHKSRIDLIEVGNIRDDFEKLADCDWIVEAVVERLDIKKDLYKRLNDVISADCVVTSNCTLHASVGIGTRRGHRRGDHGSSCELQRYGHGQRRCSV